MGEPPRISVLGLGYVGLPLAVALAAHYPVTGFDIKAGRIEEIAKGLDRTGEIGEEVLKASRLEVTADAGTLRGSDVFIVTVPTPVDSENQPDLSALQSACEILGPVIARGATVVFESTVYPGVTEEICGPWLESASGLVSGTDFFLGYSPERINPGDKEHTVDRIAKVISGQTPEVVEQLAAIYGRVTTGEIFRAASIKTAEAAKVIENAQRDINIAFVNEVTMIFHKLGISIYDVLDAANTKWNFLDFQPGLVGGHCIGVDPYYLAYRAKQVQHNPEVVLAGRRINDGMGQFVADEIAQEMNGGGRILVLGLTFKENVPDLRNSKVIDVVRGLKGHGFDVDVHDTHADGDEARQFYDVELLPSIDGQNGYACVVGAVAHDEYRSLGANRLRALLAPNGLLADIKGMWRETKLPPDVRRWQL
ncbi:MAG: nucleotide sugar dehydrogenase [Proteobacteria bacterium]|nr:nucleotide sugar dehydrogenase [Pseudomonadota bacterium]